MATILCDSSSESSEIDTAVELANRLVGWFDASVEYVIALSGGIDSAVVAKAAQASGALSQAATAHSPSVAARELDDAQRVARMIGIPHRILHTSEIDDDQYQANDLRRCYFCKSHLFESMRGHFPSAMIVTGTNLDDLADYRPGLTAAQEHCVRSPLAELSIGKSGVRDLARYWNLPIAEKPASPCLASRIAYGVAVTVPRLRMIEQAEEYLRGLGFVECRVRLHADDLARVEVSLAQLETMADPRLFAELNRTLLQLGFRYVTIDLAGFRSGSMNDVFSIGVR